MKVVKPDSILFKLQCIIKMSWYSVSVCYRAECYMRNQCGGTHNEAKVESFTESFSWGLLLLQDLSAIRQSCHAFGNFTQSELPPNFQHRLIVFHRQAYSFHIQLSRAVNSPGFFIMQYRLISRAVMASDFISCVKGTRNERLFVKSVVISQSIGSNSRIFDRQ